MSAGEQGSKASDVASPSTFSTHRYHESGTPCCRNQLKHIQKIRYVADEADQYERAWLLLADIYIQSGKFDLAQVRVLILSKHTAALNRIAAS